MPLNEIKVNNSSVEIVDDVPVYKSTYLAKSGGISDTLIKYSNTQSNINTKLYKKIYDNFTEKQYGFTTADEFSSVSNGFGYKIFDEGILSNITVYVNVETSTTIKLYILDNYQNIFYENEYQVNGNNEIVKVSIDLNIFVQRDYYIGFTHNYYPFALSICDYNIFPVYGFNPKGRYADGQNKLWIPSDWEEAEIGFKCYYKILASDLSFVIDERNNSQYGPTVDSVRALLYNFQVTLDVLVNNVSTVYSNASIGDIIILHSGFIDQRSTWVEKDNSNYIVLSINDNIAVAIPQGTPLYVEKNNSVVCLTPDAWYYSGGNNDRYPPLYTISVNDLTDHTVINPRTDIELYYIKYEFDSVNTTVTQQQVLEIESVSNAAYDLALSAKYFIDETSGLKYFITVNDGLIVLKSILYNKILVIGNSFTTHGVNEYWYARRGMAASVNYTQYTEIIKRLASASTLDIVGGVDFEYNVNSSSYDFASHIPINDTYDLVIIQLGENTSLTNETNATNNWTNLIHYIQNELPNAKIVLVLGWSKTITPIIRSVCSNNNVTVVDCTSEYNIGLLRAGDYLTDTSGELQAAQSIIITHPSDVGMVYIANHIANSINIPAQETLYNISISQTSGGTISPTYNKWPYKGVVSLRIIPDSGKSLQSITISDSNNNPINYTAKSGSEYNYICFFMPNEHVHITPQWS